MGQRTGGGQSDGFMNRTASQAPPALDRHSGGRRGNFKYFWLGLGGGGSLRAKALPCASILLVSSLAKGFGVPMAVIAGQRREISRFEAAGLTMVHASPPSLADPRSAEHALQLNRMIGDKLRLRLA